MSECSNVNFRYSNAGETWSEVFVIKPAIKYHKVVISAEAGIQINTGCRIKSGMT
jgi:hypothetical protein